MNLSSYSERLRKLAAEVETGEITSDPDHTKLRQRRVASSIRKWAEEVESGENSDSAETD